MKGGTALFVNGVYQGVLDRIVSAQSENQALICYLQPYKGTTIRGLASAQPTLDAPVKLYASVTKSLPLVSYEADVVGWRDKSSLSLSEVEAINAHLKQHQPNESLIAGSTDSGTNLLYVLNVRKLDNPLPAYEFVKVSNGEPLRPRTRAGGWSYVIPPPSLDQVAICTAEQLDKEAATEIGRAMNRSSDDRRQRLASASRFPELVNIISKGFRRNQDVIAEVLSRAGGICEECHSPAPFHRADGRPYLEVHHCLMLSEGGEDTIENAIAVCPNCHRRLHFGVH